MRWSAFLLENDPFVGLRIAGDVQVNDVIDLFLDEGNGSDSCFWEPITKLSPKLQPTAHSLKFMSYSTRLSEEPYPVFFDGRLFVLRHSLAQSGTQFVVMNLISVGKYIC